MVVAQSSGLGLGAWGLGYQNGPKLGGTRNPNPYISQHLCSTFSYACLMLCYRGVTNTPLVKGNLMRIFCWDNRVKNERTQVFVPVSETLESIKSERSSLEKPQNWWSDSPKVTATKKISRYLDWRSIWIAWINSCNTKSRFSPWLSSCLHDKEHRLLCLLMLLLLLCLD